MIEMGRKEESVMYQEKGHVGGSGQSGRSQAAFLHPASKSKLYLPPFFSHRTTSVRESTSH